ncbi:hypothetical protein ACUN0C_18085 [Faunimonas sp. B44]|uniref:hypothetical protein n=1 Tax=Faunimonas sp. B44 TaxID=3461493 RepID=UPI0040444957
MTRRTKAGSNLATIGLYAPAVVAARLQMLALEVSKPSAAGRREAVDMVAEKPLAFVLAGLAVQAELTRQTMRFWQSAFGLSRRRHWDHEAVAAAALRPLARQVRANARRLGR